MKRILTVIMIIIGGLVIVFSLRMSNYSQTFAPDEAGSSSQEAMEAFELLNNSLKQARYTYFEYINPEKITYGDSRYLADEIGETAAQLAYQDQATYRVKVEAAGYYHIYLTYQMNEAVMNNATISLVLNGQTPFYEASFLDLPLKWQDQSKEFELDSYGDQVLPYQVIAGGVLQVPLYNNTYYTAEPLLFYLEKGENSLELTNQSASPFTIKQLEVRQPALLLTYEQYRAGIAGQRGRGLITVNATEYTAKNSSHVRLFSHDSPTVTPFNPVDKKLNIISGQSWKDPGKAIEYQIRVADAGFYQLAVHYLPEKDDYHVFRTLRINGVIPFAEVKAYPFKDVGGRKFNYETLASDSGEAFEFYLAEGNHIITFTADYQPIAEQVRRLQLIIDHINQFSLDIRKITGKEVDQNRTWKLTEFIPETSIYLAAYDTLINKIMAEAARYAPNGISSSTLSYLSKALVKLERMREDPDRLPLYFEDLYSGSGSVNQMLGDTIEALRIQPLTLNEFTFYSGELNKRANASWLQGVSAGMKSFVASFTSDKYVVRNDQELLNVWVNRPITHVDTLQKLVDAEFTPATGIGVKISIMPDANKLVLASAAGEAPDVAMGLLSYMPFDLAIRGAAYDLTEFADFWAVAGRFTPGAFVPYILQDNVYALPETLEFFATVYRKDIFASLGFEVPDTWDDVTELLPELQRYGMNFYHPIAGGSSLKWFYQTSPFIYQKGGTLYSKDGLAATIDQAAAVEGLEYLAKLFTMYSLPEQEPLFYNAFRYGTLPVGITDFNTYLQIKNAAPELVGQWELAPYPGMVDQNGRFNRWIIANGRGSVIMGESKKTDEAWAFLKWWTSERVQTTYSFTLQSIYGPEFLWLSGNLAAVENSPLDMQDKVVILEQIQWLRDVPRTPGQYMLERGISDIWNRSVFNNVPTRIAIDQQLITINREIKRKMIEFGYLDENGDVLVPYTIRDIDWITAQLTKEGVKDQ